MGILVMGAHSDLGSADEACGLGCLGFGFFWDYGVPLLYTFSDFGCDGSCASCVYASTCMIPQCVVVTWEVDRDTLARDRVGSS